MSSEDTAKKKEVRGENGGGEESICTTNERNRDSANAHPINEKSTQRRVLRNEMRDETIAKRECET